jgi:hypothetical protein
MRTISEIIKDAGGARKIQEASGGSFTTDAVYKWNEIGIPDRHWPLLVDLAQATPDELFEANIKARSSKQEGAAA